jgi:methionyl-tRNA formyltransferase
MSKTVVFFGSGPVAAKSLSALIDVLGKHYIEYVVTKKRPKHHKDPAPVEEIAKEHNLPLLFASSKLEVNKILAKNKPKSKLGVVIDYGVILTKDTLDVFPFGIINSHFSLLPEWRGADPITFSILSGQTQTGVSIMRIDTELDTGDLLATNIVELDGTETSDELTEKLIERSTLLLEEIIPHYIEGKVAAYPQPKRPVTYSRKLTKSDGVLDWNKSAKVLEREIRAFSEWPKSSCNIFGTQVVVTKAKAVKSINKAIGTVSCEDNKSIIVECGKSSALKITELRPSSKKTMSAHSFINGYSNSHR